MPDRRKTSSCRPSLLPLVNRSLPVPGLQAVPAWPPAVNAPHSLLSGTHSLNRKISLADWWNHILIGGNEVLLPAGREAPRPNVRAQVGRQHRGLGWAGMLSPASAGPGAACCPVPCLLGGLPGCFLRYPGKQASGSAQGGAPGPARTARPPRTVCGVLGADLREGRRHCGVAAELVELPALLHLRHSCTRAGKVTSKQWWNRDEDTFLTRTAPTPARHC